jgi:predicted nucleic acid-binding Zn ribbon protein
MFKCPHCGEAMTKGQDVCFACGQHIRERAHHRGERPHNPLILVLTGVLVLAAVIGIIFMVSGRGRRASREAYRQKQAELAEAARVEAQAKRDSARAAVRDDVAGMLAQEVNDLEARFKLVRGQVVKDQPSPAQAKIISQINVELARLRQLTSIIAGQPGAASDSLKEQLRDGERTMRTLISGLSRAPKK